jgi:hypothetical protein
MKNRRNYYRVLHVQPDAPNQVIKASYRTLMQRLRMHPDLGGDHMTAALINEAFRTLGDPERRASYDAARREAGASSGAPSSRRREPPVESPGHAAPPPTSGESTAHCLFCGAPHSALDAERHDCVCGSCGAAIFPVQRHEGNERSRRAFDRLPRTMRVILARRIAPGDVCKAATQDVSLNGMRFLTHTHLAIDERLKIDCDFCSAVGVVRSVRPHGVDTAGWECGVQFLTLRVPHQRGGLLWTVA